MQKRDIIVIGASAGSLKPLIKLVTGLPFNLNASIFIVQHYPRGERSQLPEYLSRNGALKATQAFNGECIAKRRIYVGPSDRQMILELHSILLEEPLSRNRFRPTINAMFMSAASIFGWRVIGVILSGCLEDGAQGLAKIKNAGGISVVQRPSDALYKSMPQSALDLLPADYVLPAGDMSTLLATLVEQQAGGRA